jgi:hypothetical protein
MSQHAAPKPQPQGAPGNPRHRFDAENQTETNV